MSMQINRRDFVRSAGVGAAGIVMGAGLSRAAKASIKPNVLFIMVDQMRIPRWTPDLRMPNFDRLAGCGVSFKDHFISASPCSPSRACILTGTYTTQNKMYSNCDFVEGALQPSLDPGIPTLGHIFGRAGYRTPYRGKWHLTRKKDRNEDDALIDYGFEGWKAPEAPFGGPPYNGALMDPVYARQACDWLLDENNHKQPWFLVCSLVNPHDICGYPRYYPQRKLRHIRTDAPPDNWTDDLSTKPGAQLEYQRRYRSVGGGIDVENPDAWCRYLDYYIHCLEDVDRNIGMVLDALDRSGQRDNTIVVFTSDHGEMAGSHRLRTKGCFAYEEVINVPLIFCWPDRIPAGVSTQAMASNVDIMPTLAGMAGLTSLPYLPGRNLITVLENPDKAEVREEVIFHTDWEIQFTVFKDAGAKAIYDNPAHIRCLRDKEWKYSYYFAPGSDEVEYELYNMKDDPLEMTNLANDQGYQKRMKQMHERLMEQERKLEEDFG